MKNKKNNKIKEMGVIENLILKVIDKKRMPSIRSIHSMLDNFGIEHLFSETQNICETRSGQNVYVNSRWDGKKGYEIEVFGIHLDTSDSYYSWNSWQYAKKIIEKLVENKYITKKLVKEISGENFYRFNLI